MINQKRAGHFRSLEAVHGPMGELPQKLDRQKKDKP